MKKYNYDECRKNCGNCPNHKDCIYWNAWDDLPTAEEENEAEGFED